MNTNENAGDVNKASPATGPKFQQIFLHPEIRFMLFWIIAISSIYYAIQNFGHYVGLTTDKGEALRLEEAVQPAAVKVPETFRRWSYSQINDAGEVIIWSGATAEILSVEKTPNCSSFGQRLGGNFMADYLPCWNIYARTPNNRYFHEVVYLTEDLKFVADEKSRQVAKKELTELAIRRHNQALLKKIDVTPSDA